MSDFWLAELDDELHECAVPSLRRGRIFTCRCGCIWEAVPQPVHPYRPPVLRWALVRDPDRVAR